MLVFLTKIDESDFNSSSLLVAIRATQSTVESFLADRQYLPPIPERATLSLHAQEVKRVKNAHAGGCDLWQTKIRVSFMHVTKDQLNERSMEVYHYSSASAEEWISLFISDRPDRSAQMHVFSRLFAEPQPELAA